MSTLRPTVKSGVKWTAASMLGRAVLQFAQLAIFSRTLSPTELGLYAVTNGVVSLLQIFSEVGISANIIQRGLVTRSFLTACRTVSGAIGGIVGLTLLLCAPVISHFYQRADGLQTALAVISICPIFLGIGQPYRALAEKSFAFKKIALIELIACLAGVSVGTLLAASPLGLTGAVIGLVLLYVSQSTLFVVLFCSPDTRVSRFTVIELREVVSFGGFALLNNVTATLIQQADIFIGGKVLGARELAIFSLPRELCLRVGMAINPIATRVSLPLMAKLKADHSALSNAYATGLNAANSLSFPAYVFLATHAEYITTHYFGARWSGNSTVLQILALWGLFRSITNPTGALLYATGNVRRACIWNLFSLVTLAPIIYISSTFGATALACGALLFVFTTSIASWAYIVHPIAGLRFIPFTSTILRPGACSLLAAASSRTIFPIISSTTVALISAAVFALIYVAATRTLNTPMWKLLNVKHDRFARKEDAQGGATQRGEACR